MSSTDNNSKKHTSLSVTEKNDQEDEMHARQTSLSPITRLETKMWKVFVQRQHEQHWARGCSYLNEFAQVEHHSSPFITSSPTNITEVDLDTWNKYWELYSDTYGSKLDALTAEFKNITTMVSTNNHNDMYSDENMYRRVLVSVRSVSTSDNNDSSSCVQTEELQKVMHDNEKYLHHVAHKLGAIESCSCAGRIFRVQFTTSLAARMFLSWANKLSVEALNTQYTPQYTISSCGLQKNTENFDNHTISTNTEYHNTSRSECVQTSIVEELEEERKTNGKKHLWMSLELVARLAPCDLRVVSSVLQLGPNIRIPTAFVHSLFCNVFEAKEVTYMQHLNSFLIYFTDNVTAQTALHAAQSSLYHCFGLTLTYYHDNVQ